MTAASPALVDTHAHLQDPAFREDLEVVLARAKVAGVEQIVCVGYDLRSSRAAVALASRHEGIYAAVGIHPNAAGRAEAGAWEEIRRLARSTVVVGIGETGLDNYRKRTAPEVQEVWLRRHLELAAELEKPAIIHNREADRRVGEILGAWVDERPSRRMPGVLHCFSAGAALMAQLVERGFAVSIAGPVTYKNARELPSVAARVPAERLVVETDCPYLPPHPHRGQRNEPAYVALTAIRLAELRGESFEVLAALTTANARALFGLPDLEAASA